MNILPSSLPLHAGPRSLAGKAQPSPVLVSLSALSLLSKVFSLFWVFWGFFLGQVQPGKRDL